MMATERNTLETSMAVIREADDEWAVEELQVKVRRTLRLEARMVVEDSKSVSGKEYRRRRGTISGKT